jgi:DNA-directed RNA polymerase subunit L
MEIKVLENEKNRLHFELVGKTHTLANFITKELWNDSDVIVSGYNLKHPETANVSILIETKKKDPKKVLMDTLKNLQKKNKDFLANFKKVAK